ncbi:hypothetical protein [Undibacterium fentianense]|uniref:Lipoprotein n=1 Tax=Undibacterium fentianense TaxID=2828728 RepID=A0A941E626_9BURK|nr:hypothetical protein [Undibacterium fentianense]MBR7801817.1 hypothetical protein [Undibacterium fentianense]
MFDAHSKLVFPGLLLSLCFSLSGCGGGNNTSSTNLAGNNTSQGTPGFSCSGAVKELFTAVQGTYDGIVDSTYLSESGNPLTKGVVYPISISGQDCSIRFTGNKQTNYVFAFGDPTNTSPSVFVGFSATEILQNPESLDLKNVQYNVSISSPTNTVELERRIAKNAIGTETIDGDLHFYSVPGPNAFGGMHMKIVSRRPLK